VKAYDGTPLSDYRLAAPVFPLFSLSSVLYPSFFPDNLARQFFRYEDDCVETPAASDVDFYRRLRPDYVNVVHRVENVPFP